MLYERDIERFARQNKDDFEESLHEYSDLYPALEEVTTGLTKDEMEAEAKQAIQEDIDPEGLSDEVKTEAIEDLAERQSGAVMVPRGQAVMRIPHPDLDGVDPFELNVFPGMNDEDTEGALEFTYSDGPIGRPGQPDDPEERLADETRPEQMDVAATPISEVPSWAAPYVFDRIVSGRIAVYESAEAAQRSLDQVTQETKNILGDDTGTLRMEPEVEETGEFPDGTPKHDIFTEPSGNFTDQSQAAAWAVLNEPVDGEPPVPEDRSSDTSVIGEEEKQRVRRRIKTCLENPRRFADLTREEFDEKTFFNQLLQCEFQGFTPPRTSGQQMAESMRPDVFRIIRQIARDRGFEVVGDYVRPRPDEPQTIDFKEDALNPDEGLLQEQTVAEEARAARQ